MWSASGAVGLVQPPPLGRTAALARLNQGPVPRHGAWLKYVQSPQTEAELAALRRSVERGVPYGRPDWVARSAELLDLESSLHSSGRPPKGSARKGDEGGPSLL